MRITQVLMQNPSGLVTMTAYEDHVYLAKLAEQAERYEGWFKHQYRTT